MPAVNQPLSPDNAVSVNYCWVQPSHLHLVTNRSSKQPRYHRIECQSTHSWKAGPCASDGLPRQMLLLLLLLHVATGCFCHLKLCHRPYEALPCCQVK